MNVIYLIVECNLADLTFGCVLLGNATFGSICNRKEETNVIKWFVLKQANSLSKKK